jgi:cell surface protein SprA
LADRFRYAVPGEMKLPKGLLPRRLGNTRNEPDFKQQVQINVNGTIGDKLNIVADWNTERTFEYENQLKIKYTGYDDEIIQSIEAGNVTLQTSPLIGGSEALFGLKAQFKMGPFTLTTLASQKKGETKEVSVSSGTTTQEFQIRAYDYSTNHYFLDALYAKYRPVN